MGMNRQECRSLVSAYFRHDGGYIDRVTGSSLTVVDPTGYSPGFLRHDFEQFWHTQSGQCGAVWTRIGQFSEHLWCAAIAGFNELLRGISRHR